MSWYRYLICLLPLAACSVPSSQVLGSSRYEDLTALFAEWRAFQAPGLVDGVPDYSAAAMEVQHRDLARYQARLGAIDRTGWPAAREVDYQLVRAEMSGLDFDHRVLRPWQRNPAFYATLFPSQSDVPAREGPHAAGAIELWTYAFPLAAERAAELERGLSVIPRLLAQARRNLTGNARDLWVAGIRTIKQQSRDLGDLADRLAGQATVAVAARGARAATDSFAMWLETQAPSKTGPSGVGIREYTWYLQNVQLLPYTWQDQVVLMRRELVRAHAALRLSEQRNRGEPQLSVVASEAEHRRRFHAAVTEYMRFLADQEIVTVRDYMDAALRARIGRFVPGRREFFAEVDYRDPVVMRTHGYHWFDLARMEREPHPNPIRRRPLLYNIFAGRAEGLATGMEEMMLLAGLFDARPRARELIYVLLAQRAARALGDLLMHANQLSLDQAVAFAAQWTPRGWLARDGSTVWGEQHLYLQQPSYGTSYLIGKIEIEQLLAERALQLGDRFTVKRFMDELNDAGMIPVPLIRFELAASPPAPADSVRSPEGEPAGDQPRRGAAR
jgi:hypothetical protein